MAVDVPASGGGAIFADAGIGQGIGTGRSVALGRSADAREPLDGNCSAGIKSALSSGRRTTAPTGCGGGSCSADSRAEDGSLRFSSAGPPARRGIYLGLLLLEPGRWQAVQQQIVPADFTDPQLRQIVNLFWSHQPKRGRADIKLSSWGCWRVGSQKCSDAMGGGGLGRG